MAGSHRETCSQIKPTPDFCPGCGAQPMNGDPVLHDELCQHEHPDLVCGQRLGRGDICAVKRPCPEHDIARAKLQLWIACGYIHAGGRGDHLVPMAKRAQARIEELTEIVHDQAQRRRMAEADVRRLEGELAKLQSEHSEFHTRTATALDENARDLATWRDAASMFSVMPVTSPIDLAERLRAMISQRDATAVERDRAIDERTRLSEKVGAIVATMCEIGMGTRPVEADVAELASEYKSNTERMHEFEKEARALRHRAELAEGKRDAENAEWSRAASSGRLVDKTTPRQLEVRIADMSERLAAAESEVTDLRARAEQVAKQLGQLDQAADVDGGRIQELEAKLAEMRSRQSDSWNMLEEDRDKWKRLHDELAREMVSGADPTSVMESVEALRTAGMPQPPAPSDLRDAFLDSIAQATADRMFEWLTGAEAE